ncbi:MAG TPA: hypothetical protein VN661_10470 [Candidatus Acidoferrales bacterium]|nr:hypothetical protein [Candidatus Acidoferrales bacterium]
MPRNRKPRKARYRLGLEISPEILERDHEPHVLRVEDGLKAVYRWLELGDRALQNKSRAGGSD